MDDSLKEWKYPLGAPLPRDIRQFLLVHEEVLAHDVRQLRRLRDSPDFVPSAFWPSRKHVHVTLLETAAWLTAAKEYLACILVGDVRWQRANEIGDYAMRLREYMDTLPRPCSRSLLPRPLMKWCNENQWGTSRECLRGASGGHRHGGTGRRRR